MSESEKTRDPAEAAAPAAEKKPRARKKAETPAAETAAKAPRRRAVKGEAEGQATAAGPDKSAAKKTRSRAAKAAPAPDPAAQLAETVCAFLSSKKAEDIVVVDVREKTVLCDYFVIASGRNTTQVKALCENLEEKLSKDGVEPRRSEGVKEGRWGVLDYGDVIVHIFNDESRLFYHLERLWGEGDNLRRWE